MVQGSLRFFGTYSVSEEDHTLNLRTPVLQSGLRR